MGLFNDRLHQGYIFTTIVITFWTVFILTHPVNFPCGRKPERQDQNAQISAERWQTLFTIESAARIEPTISEVTVLALTNMPPKPLNYVTNPIPNLTPRPNRNSNPNWTNKKIQKEPPFENLQCGLLDGK
jgi:hypothetical protein